jgi:acetyl-CoA carboxylase biotin carboxyl carrier protein
VALDLDELRELLTAINQTDIAELTLKSADFELTVRRGWRTGESVYVSGNPQPAIAETVASAVPLAAAVSPIPSSPPIVAGLTSSSSPQPPPTSDLRLLDINSPMVGTFYRSPAPNEAPFVEVGDRVRKGQTVCIIEAMKLMNEIEAEISGEVVEVLLDNGEPVEYGQTLIRINPD